jgi:repressor LexA
MEPLTEKQQKILKYIESRLQRNNPSRAGAPSQREIARHFGMAQNSVYQLVSYLKEKGYITTSPGHRNLSLSKKYLDKIKQSEGIPLVGTVAAGLPILAQENIREYIDPGEIFGRTDGVFILKVSGDSMVDEGIMDGDFVVVRSGTEVTNGRIGVVLINDEATVKKVYIQKNRIALEPANKAAGYKTMYIKKNSDNIRVIGRVTGCFRKL